jgi:hypothetical protein
MSSIKYIPEAGGIKYGDFQATSSEAYGGHIISASVSLGYNAPSTATISIVSQNGLYDIETKDLYVSACKNPPSILTFGLNSNTLNADPNDNKEEEAFKESSKGFAMFVYPVSFTLAEGPGGRTLEVELVEASVDYFSRTLVVTENNVPEGDREKEGILYVGTEYFTNNTTTRNEMISREDILRLPDTYPALYEKARTEFGTYYYTPADLAKELRKKSIPCTDEMINFLKKYNDLYLSDTGTLQSILQDIGSKLGVMFFWNGIDAVGQFQLDWNNLNAEAESNEPVVTIGIDVLREAEITPTRELETNIFGPEKKGLLAKTLQVSISDTSVTSQIQRVELAGGVESNPKYLAETKLTRLTPVFGKINVCGKKTQVELFKAADAVAQPPEGAADGGVLPDGYKRAWMRLNLLKAIALGPEFARSYILLKKAGASREKIKDGGSPIVAGDGYTADNLGGTDDEKKAPYINNFDAVVELFPDDCCKPSDNKCEDYNVFVVAPGSPEGKDFKPPSPADPNAITALLAAVENRNPKQKGRLSNIEANPRDIQAFKKQLMVLNVRNEGAGADAKAPKSKIHPFVPQQPNMSSNDTYAQLEKFLKAINSYYYAVGSFTPNCYPEDTKDEDKFTYAHKNWPATPAPEFDESPSQIELQEVRVQDLGWIRPIGEAYAGTSGFEDLSNQFTAIADFVQNLGYNGLFTGAYYGNDAPPAPAYIEFDQVNEKSCISPISAEGATLQRKVDKVNCAYNSTNTIKFWKNDSPFNIPLTAEVNAFQVTDNYTELLKNTPVVDKQINNYAENSYSAVVAYKPTGKHDVGVKVQSFTGDTQGKNIGFSTVGYKVKDVDDLDYMLENVDIGIDLKGLPTNNMSVNQILTPDRYYQAKGVLIGGCENSFGPNENYFNNQPPNIEIFDDTKVLSLIPDSGGTGAANRSEYSDLKPGTGCDYEKQAGEIEDNLLPYSGLTSQAKNIIENNMAQIAKTQFELNKFTDPTYNYSYECVGVPEGGLPNIKDGLSTLGIDVGTDGPKIKFTVGSKKIRRTVLEQDKKATSLQNGVRKIDENDTDTVFSKRFLNKIAQGSPPMTLTKAKNVNKGSPPTNPSV